MTWRLRLAALLTTLCASAPGPAVAGDPAAAFATGVAALQAGDLARAESVLGGCAGTGSPTALNCAWEAGWAAYARGRWDAAIRFWTVVEKGDPTRKDLADSLGQARDNQALAALLAAGASATPKAPAAVPAGTRLRVRAVGDLMIGTVFPEGVLNPAVDATFAGVADWLSDADLTFGNLEGPLCDAGETTKCKPESPPGACYAFRSPGAYARLYAAAGFDVLSTANNHAADFGYACRRETERHLDAVGIAHTGRPADIATRVVHGLRVGVIGFHTNRNSHYVNAHDEAAALVRAVAATHDLVIVSFHGGAEGGRATRVPDGPEVFYGEDRGDLRRFARAVIAAGADLVLGHGPHVPRGMELVDGRLVVYSMGNFATYGRFNLKGDQGLAMVVEATLAPDGRFLGGRILPAVQAGGGVPEKDPSARVVSRVAELTALDFPTTGVRVGPDGTLSAPSP